MAATDARIIPIKNLAYRLTFDAYNIVAQVTYPNTNGTGMDTKVSKDGAAFADATNEAIEIAPSSGVYYIDLTADEMNADTVVVRTSFTNAGSFTLPIFLYPQKAGDLVVNVVQVGGVAQTGRDIGASVLLSPGTGAGQLDITSGVVKANLVQILATALTETAGQLTAGFKKFFNVATPTSDMNTITAVTATATATALGTQAKTDVQAALTAQGYTTARAGYLDTLNGLVAAVWAYVVEGTHTARGYLRIIKSVLAGTVTDANTTNPKFYDDAGTVVRVDATTDGSGNRTSVTLDES